MEIIYKRDNSYSTDDVRELFLSVDWISGKYPERLKRALDNCETVIAAWAGDKLVGLINVIDDGELTAYIHYLCVNPEYQGLGIGGELLKQIREKYRDYLYIIVIAENENLIEYYKKNGFEHISGRFVLEVQNG
ncbi:MAG: GNAT family N-acetyltransferase [Lachnospiraceae bacterium]|nr:GNAT family N-acetyltransferase [Lachnospiraceae bacterium]